MTPPSALGVPATIGRRVGGYLIDAAIGGVIVLIPWLVFSAVIGASGSGMELGSLLMLAFVGYGVVALVGVAWLVVVTLMQGGRGSIGQRLVGIRLGDAATSERIGFWRALLRNVVWGLAAAIVVGYFTPLFDSTGRRQGWHDKAGGAVVLDRKATEAALAEANRPAPPAPPKPNPFLPPPPNALPDEVSRPVSNPAEPVASPAPPVTGVSAAGFAPPASTAAAATPAHPVAQSGIIAGIPDFRAGAATAAPVPPASAAPAPAAPADPTAAPPPSSTADDVDETRAAPAPRAVLTWDDGTRIAVYGRTLFGRNPAAEDDAIVVAVRDETLSLSKTHFELHPDDTGVWVIDRHSTNGVTLVRDDARTPLEAGGRQLLRTADVLEFGDRRAVVGRVS